MYVSSPLILNAAVSGSSELMEEELRVTQLASCYVMEAVVQSHEVNLDRARRLNLTLVGKWFEESVSTSTQIGVK